MASGTDPEEIAARREDELQLRDLAFRYARMMDRREFDLRMGSWWAPGTP
jgi:hypothetical protein